MVFTEKYIRILGSDKGYSHRSVQHLLLVGKLQYSTSDVCIAQTVYDCTDYIIETGKYFALCSIDAIADALTGLTCFI